MRRALGTHRLDIVAVGIDQERGMVGRAVIGARAGRAVVAAAGLDAFGVEFPDRGVIRSAERDMRARALQPLEDRVGAERRRMNRSSSSVDTRSVRGPSEQGVI